MRLVFDTTGYHRNPVKHDGNDGGDLLELLTTTSYGYATTSPMDVFHYDCCMLCSIKRPDLAISHWFLAVSNLGHILCFVFIFQTRAY